MFRPFTGITAIVMVPMSIAVYAHPDVVNGMPFWAFGLMAIGVPLSRLATPLFLDWFTPPGAEDPFARYPRSER